MRPVWVPEAATSKGMKRRWWNTAGGSISPNLVLHQDEESFAIITTESEHLSI